MSPTTPSPTNNTRGVKRKLSNDIVDECNDSVLESSSPTSRTRFIDESPCSPPPSPPLATGSPLLFVHHHLHPLSNPQSESHYIEQIIVDDGFDLLLVQFLFLLIHRSIKQ
ncbi:hypothetical protein BLOT_005232 [Blomia tropicalis]|nr:hypothetical protein BLOT_005232 [Blomia tropicalis]